MAKLSDEEQAQLDALQRKRDEPDPEPARGPAVNVHVDLSDDAAVERAIGLGLLTKAEVDELKDGEPGEGEPEDDAPEGRKRSLSDRWSS